MAGGGVRIGFASEDWGSDATGRAVPGGSNWWRVQTPARWLREQGHTVVVGRAVGRTDLAHIGVVPYDQGRFLPPEAAIFDVDVLVLHRAMWHSLPDAIRAARRGGQRIVADIDDWYWGLRTTNAAFTAAHPTVSPDENVNHLRKVLAAADVVTASTPYLAGRVGQWCPRVEVVRNAPPVDWFPPPPDRDDSDSERGWLGWVGAVPWRSGDLETLRGILAPWYRQHPGWGWYHGGHVPDAPAAADLAGVPPGVPRRTAGMAAPDRYPALWEPLDVAVIPLADAPFNYAKSAIKGIEACLAGVAWVAAALPEYRWLHDHGVGRVARTPRQWLAHLHDLTDADTRRDEAARNLAAVKQFTVDQQGPGWEHVLCPT